MLSFLRSLTPSQQVGALFVSVFGLLAIISIAAFLLTFRTRSDARDESRHEELRNFRRLLGTSWFMVTVFWAAWAAGDLMGTLLFALIAFLALREFITLSPTRRADHRSLVLAFFVVLPVQFWLAATRHFDLFTVFIPVYVFLALPVASALGGDTQRFLERNAKLQWGIVVCIYGMSHVPALLLLDFSQRNFTGKGAFLVFFMVFVIQTCMVVQHLLTRRLRRPPSIPGVSSSFNWPCWAAGMAAGSLLGGALSFITPFTLGQAVGMAAIACAAGSLGHLVMKALKRDRGVPAWGPRAAVTGANGLLDRVDALCFGAPIFFHSVRWYFGA
ncbi:MULTISPECIES: phosphatidate cytidylyltransferase [Ramlibacter]|uniref:Phosphatidate cytidylyltransferase n=1 Tax=Ramlibacter pinisoli TaxID=2682844 RepID=A0A6N8IZJ2_9BURK|nr:MULTISPECIES: phosphatidate cytidylyltransferase [Ramlibacter]MBA2962462.1 phosphatidate cytidylyltransferase [Ramlibacter sp. CGMCC 1.13660]MVQ32404.1 phosphatidate cytidylyltransferase [Ramlibacter pinisoli]